MVDGTTNSPCFKYYYAKHLVLVVTFIPDLVTMSWTGNSCPASSIESLL